MIMFFFNIKFFIKIISNKIYHENFDKITKDND